jgi:Ser-tRNA(Ala) deacylase AlaX
LIFSSTTVHNHNLGALVSGLQRQAQALPESATMQRTLLAFQRNGSLTTLPAVVRAVRTIGSLDAEDRALFKQAQDDDHIVITDATIFHPQGGGQPSDQGSMHTASGAWFDVQSVRMAASQPDLAFHLGRFKNAAEVESPIVAGVVQNGLEVTVPPIFRPDEPVTQTLDTEKRLLYSRYHTAGHVLGAAVRHLLEDKIEGFDETKASHVPGSASCEFIGAIEGKWKDDIQARLDAYIEQDMPVEIDWWDEGDFRANGLERLTPDRQAMGLADGEKFRVVKIVGAETYPCGGTHVASTKLCGKTDVRKISRSKGTSRVGYNLP